MLPLFIQIDDRLVNASEIETVSLAVKRKSTKYVVVNPKAMNPRDAGRYDTTEDIRHKLRMKSGMEFQISNEAFKLLCETLNPKPMGSTEGWFS